MNRKLARIETAITLTEIELELAKNRNEYAKAKSKLKFLQDLLFETYYK